MSKKILLADDSLTIQKVVELTFSDSDFELVCVSNGQRALDKVREERPDLILADVVMPEKNGYEVCEAIKGNPATAKIPVVLLSGTFEPFDRDRAERIGADAIVSKPFDSQQLLSQVEALLARTPSQAPATAATSGATTVVVPMSSIAAPPPLLQGTEPVPKPAEESSPFDAGFTAEDFTGNVRLPAPPEKADPFEEEYGRGGVDSAIEAFEQSHPGFGFSGDAEIEIDDRRLSGKALVEERPAGPAKWLDEEAERAPAKAPLSADAFDIWTPGESGNEVAPPLQSNSALRGPLATPSFGEAIAAATGGRVSEKGPGKPAPAPPAQVPGEAGETVAIKGPLDAPRPQQPHELEALAQGTSIPELTEMLSTVARTNGGLSDADIERLAAKVVEKLSDKVVREIAWEVIPDMAEIVIKQRIKELESGIE